ncbi:hypothetical protein, partial [Rhizobium leguminosarum]|uniref:hypothetical protein n=1 Tax=Rhizobium leguminosarum TaxID=384 RepID=UPI003F94BD03
LRNKANEAKLKGMTVLQAPKKETKPAAKPEDPIEEGTELVLRNLSTGKELKFKLATDYYFSKEGTVALVETSKKNNDSVTQASLVWVNLSTLKADTIFRKF